MTDEEFDSMIHNFDEFMEKQGYYSMQKVSDYLLLNNETIRMRIHRGMYPGTVTIGHKCYIPFEALREKVNDT